MKKALKAIYQDKCTGCELCVFEAQRQLKKVGLEGSLIRVFKDHDQKIGTTYRVVMDTNVNRLNIEKISKICPFKVFELVEEDASHDLTD